MNLIRIETRSSIFISEVYEIFIYETECHYCNKKFEAELNNTTSVWLSEHHLGELYCSTKCKHAFLNAKKYTLKAFKECSVCKEIFPVGGDNHQNPRNKKCKKCSSREKKFKNLNIDPKDVLEYIEEEKRKIIEFERNLLNAGIVGGGKKR